jgi:hypothetical protein
MSSRNISHLACGLVVVCLALDGLAGSAAAGELRLQPGDITLTGPHASQRLLVLEEEGGRVVGDRTVLAVFTSSNPDVAAVDLEGTVRAAGDGAATVTARYGGREAAVKVTVRKTREPFTWSFRNHVIPVLTRVGCNAGACHGALAGKGGLKLSLRGYNPTDDHFVLTRQALGGAWTGSSRPAACCCSSRP